MYCMRIVVVRLALASRLGWVGRYRFYYCRQTDRQTDAQAERQAAVSVSAVYS